MTREDALTRLIQVVHKNARHTWYTRTVELAQLYRKLVTGDGLDTLLRQFVKREDDASFAQRVNLTHHVVTAVVKNIMDVFEKVPRSNYQRILEYEADEAKGKIEALDGLIKRFWGVKSLDDYTRTRFLELNATDPNTFIVTEFKDFDHNSERAQSYPFEVYSPNAVDYQYENNVLQYLTAMEVFLLPTKRDKDKKGESYTLYLPDETLRLTEVDPATVSVSAPSKEAEFVFREDGTAYLLSNKRVFVLTASIPHNAHEVPAKPVGYLRDAWTNGTTFVAPYDAAVPILMKSIKVNSELDITMSQQVFPHRLQYMPPCKAPDCKEGFTLNGDKCGVCNGSGHDSITSAQEVIYIRLPKNPADLLDLDKLLVFKGPPVELVQFQTDYVARLTDSAKSYVFNGESLERPKVNITTTATENLLDRDNLNDTLFRCSNGYTETWTYLVRMTAKFAQLDKGLIYRLIFLKDLIRKGLTELLQDLEAANRSEAGPAVRQSIQTDIARIINADNPRGFKIWQAKESFNPFSGYSEAQVALALSDPAIPQRVKTQYLMFGLLFEDLEYDFSIQEPPLDFYALSWKLQREAVAAKVLEYTLQATPAKPTFTIPQNINAN